MVLKRVKVVISLFAATQGLPPAYKWENEEEATKALALPGRGGQGLNLSLVGETGLVHFAGLKEAEDYLISNGYEIDPDETIQFLDN